MSNVNPFLLPSDEQYDGTNWIPFKAKIRAVAKQRGTLGYLDGTITRPPTPLVPPIVAPTPTTYWGATNPSVDEWDQRDSWTQGLITLNVKNAIGLGVKLDGSAHETYRSIADIKDKASDLGCITAENQLNDIKYIEGTDMEEHIGKLRTAWTLANAQGAEIKDEKFRMIVLRSLPSSWLPFVGSLYGETTSASVIERIVQHSLFIASISRANPTTVQALSTQSKGRNSNLKCSNPKCGKTGHLIDRCFAEGGGMAGQYPDWWKKNKKFGGGGGATGGGATGGGATVGGATSGGATGGGTTSSNQQPVIAASAISDPARYYAFSAMMSGHFPPLDDHNSDIESYADSAASSHFFRDRGDFIRYHALSNGPTGQSANGTFQIVGVGTVVKHVIFEGRVVQIKFENAMHAPDLQHNLISIGRMVRLGYGVMFMGDRARFLDRDGVAFMESEGMGMGTMFRLKFVTTVPAIPTAFSARSLSKPTDLETWHRRLGHVAEDTVKRMAKDGIVDGLVITSKEVHGRCEDCIFGKQTRRPFDAVVEPEDRTNLRAYMDLWGPATTATPSGKVYMFQAVDGSSDFTEVFFLGDKTMGSTLVCLTTYHKRSEKVTGNPLINVRTDNGPEFKNSEWKEYFKENGIHHEFTATYSSASNGTAERGNRTILDRVRTMLHDAKLPGTYWAEAAATAVYELWFGTKPDISHIRPFGCTAYAKIPDAINDGKLAPRSVKCVLLGYAGTGVYRLLDRSTGRIFESRDVVFEEGEAHRTTDPTGFDEDPDMTFSTPDTPPSLTPPVANSDASSDSVGVHQETPVGDADRITLSAPNDGEGEGGAGAGGPVTATAGSPPVPAAPLPSRIPRPRIIYPPASRRSTRIAGGQPEAALVVSSPGLDDHSVPLSYKEAAVRMDLWKEPMDDEMGKMKDMEVWRLAERPLGAKVMKPGWVFTVKEDDQGEIVRRKARLVAKGHTLIPGVHFAETYASAARYESIRIMLAAATVRKMFLWQADYTSAYLNAPNQVKILMELPEGYEVTSLDGYSPCRDKVAIPNPSGPVYEVVAYVPNGGEIHKVVDSPSTDNIHQGATDSEELDLVAVLDKSIYGVGDSGRNWFDTLSKSMKGLNYYQSRADQSVRAKLEGGEHTITCTYTDDITGMNDTEEGYRRAVAELGSDFDIKDLGKLKSVIGLGIKKDEETGILTISQEPYILKTLERFGYADCSPKYTPLPQGIDLRRTTGPIPESDYHFMLDKPYREVLGCIMFIQMATRPDLSYAVASLSRFASNPGPEHWKAITHVLHYLKATSHFKLRYGGEKFTSYSPIGYVDSDYATDPDKRRSISGYVCLQAGGPTSWSSKYQHTIASSTAEAEYVAQSRGAQQIMWMLSSLEEVGLSQPRPAQMFSDNDAARHIANNSTGAAKVKHVDVREHYIRERVSEGDIRLDYIPTSENLADLLTKPLGRTLHWKFCLELRLCTSDDPLLRGTND